MRAGNKIHDVWKVPLATSAATVLGGCGIGLDITATNEIGSSTRLSLLYRVIGSNEGSK